MKTIMIVIWICAAVPLFAGPLHDAARKGDTAALARALAAGESVNGKDAGGVTPLMEASWHGRLEAVKFLIAKKADVNAKSAKGGTALMEACIKGYAPVVKALVDAGAKE